MAGDRWVEIEVTYSCVDPRDGARAKRSILIQRCRRLTWVQAVAVAERVLLRTPSARSSHEGLIVLKAEQTIMEGGK